MEKTNEYANNESGIYAECKEIIRLAREISSQVDRPIKFVKG